MEHDDLDPEYEEIFNGFQSLPPPKKSRFNTERDKNNGYSPFTVTLVIDDDEESGAQDEKTAETDKMSEAEPSHVDDKNDEAVMSKPANKICHLGKYILIVLALCVIMTVSMFIQVYDRLNYVEINTSCQDIPAGDAPNWRLQKHIGVKNILILGIDGAEGKKNRSDTIIILSIDQFHRQIKMTSVLRDTYLFIPGRDEGSRINHAYSYGGAELTMQTLESNFRIDLEDYVSVDMDGLTAIISAVGGVEVNLTSGEADELNRHFKCCSFSGGKHHLSAEEAVYYARIRKIDSDFERTARQRNLIKILLKKISGMSFGEKYELIFEVSPYLTTNISKFDLVSLSNAILMCSQNDVEELRIPADGTYKAKNISGMSVLVPDVKSNCELMHKFIFGRTPIEFFA